MLEVESIADGLEIGDRVQCGSDHKGGAKAPGDSIRVLAPKRK